MHRVSIVISAILIFCLISFAIYQKQQSMKKGELVFFEISSKHHRSKIQGDYLAIRYLLEEEMENTKLPDSFHQGYAVIKEDKNKVGHFVRIYNGETLANSEKLVKFYYRPKSPIQFVIKPDTFFFTEGKEKKIAHAKYVIFNYHGHKEYMLIGVADKDMKPL